jgi:ketosteroid isomerase-like protein
MSQENVEIVRQAYECIERGDWDRMADLLHPNAEQHGTIGGVEEGFVARGISQIRQNVEQAGEAWDEQHVEPEKFIDAGDRVVVFQREYQRGKSSGVELVVETAEVFDLRGGRIARMQGFMDRATALEAVGLSKQDAHADSN